MQYSRLQQAKLANCFLTDALSVAPADPLVLNELAVLATRESNWDEALVLLEQAVSALKGNDPSEYCDCILFNLATVYRKQRKYESAVEWYIYYVKCRPNASHGYTALGFTLHLMGRMVEAVDYYHQSLLAKQMHFAEIC